MRPLARALQTAAAHLQSHRAALVEACVRSLDEIEPRPDPDLRGFCSRALDELLFRLSRGEVEELLEAEAARAVAAARAGAALHSHALAIRVVDRCSMSLLVKACPDAASLGECLTALGELSDRRLEILLRAQEEELQHRLHEAQEQAAGSADRARDLARANEALRRSEAQSQYRAEQIGMLGSVAHRLAGILDPERLMQEAAETIQARLNHTYVAVVVLDDEGVLVGRWAGRKGVGRRSAGRTQGPAGGIIGRALRKKSPQVVPDVSRDPEHFPDVPGACSEMAIPLLEDGEVVGALDFQSEKPAAFGLDDVTVGETLAEFLVVALRNARLFAEARRSRG